MQHKIDYIHKNYTWDLVDLPKGKKPIITKQVFNVKNKLDGTIDRYKARLVEKGYAQQKGIEYDETFAPTSFASIVRSFVSIVDHYSWKVHQLDIKITQFAGCESEGRGWAVMIRCLGQYFHQSFFFICHSPSPVSLKIFQILNHRVSHFKQPIWSFICHFGQHLFKKSTPKSIF